MPDLLEQQGRPFRVTLGVLIESMLKRGPGCSDTWRLWGSLARSSRGLAPSKPAEKRQTALDTHRSTQDQWWHECTADGGIGAKILFEVELDSIYPIAQGNRPRQQVTPRG